MHSKGVGEGLLYLAFRAESKAEALKRLVEELDKGSHLYYACLGFTAVISETAGDGSPGLPDRKIGPCYSELEQRRASDIRAGTTG